VNLVYTRPQLKKKGNATACVAALTQRMLDSGKRFCCLYTDLTNPTSNLIYRKIGYQPICDVQDWIFEQPQTLPEISHSSRIELRRGLDRKA
jgi:predicted GNAT family acetyltransferase